MDTNDTAPPPVHAPLSGLKRVLVRGVRALARFILDATDAHSAPLTPQALYPGVMEAVPDSLMVTDLDGTLLFVNEMAARRIGGTPESLTGRKVDEVRSDIANRVLNMDALIEASEREAADPEAVTGVTIEMESGEFYHRFSVPYRSGSGAVVGRVISLRDVTKTVATQRELAEKERAHLHQSRLAAMGEMVAAIAHQWRQPLNAMGLYVQELTEYHERDLLDDEAVNRITTRCLEQISFMSKTIDDFRNFYRPAYRKESFIVTDAVGDTLSLLHKQLEAEAIDVSVYCGGSEPGDRTFVRKEGDRVSVTCAHGVESCLNGCSDGGLLVRGYRNEFQQAVLNFITNARNAILRTRGKAGGRIRIDLQRSEDRVIVRILDNGGGVPEHAMDRIFDPYYTTHPDDGGTGIGLPMSKTIIEKNMNGRLTISNDEDGAVVTVDLPKVSGVSLDASTPA